MDMRAVVVDDEQLARDELGYLLGQLGGIEVIGQAGNGVEALSTIERLQPDVVFLDVQMPGLTGFDVLKKIRQTKSVTDLPVLMVTSSDDSDSVVEALELGANDYIMKPLDFPVALARIRTQLLLRRVVVALEEAKQVLRGVELTETLVEALTDADAAVIVTEWDELNGLLAPELRKAMRTPLIVDGRNLLDPGEARAAGFAYESIGRAAHDLDALPETEEPETKLHQ